MQHKGRANGGPLDGTQIEAGDRWSGRIERDLTGMYRWDPLLSRWDWEERAMPPSGRGGRPSRAKASTPPKDI